MSNIRLRARGWARLGLVALALPLALAALSNGADHRDGPVFGPPGLTITQSRRDINDIYVFQSPANAANTVLVLTVSPFSGATTPDSFDPSCVFEYKIDNTGDFVEDITFRMTFGAPDGAGVQPVTLRGFPSSKFPKNGGILARGLTRQNLAVDGGGQFRAAMHDDPFFFDAVGTNQLLNGLPGGQVFPRPRQDPAPAGLASNFFGPNVNTLATILEVPSALLHSASGNTNLRVWSRAEVSGRQIDRMGFPGFNTVLVPPVPRGTNPAIQPLRADFRNAYNAGLPRNDQRDFRAAFLITLTTVYGRNATQANGLADALLPDALPFNTQSTNGFDMLNGRRLRDDVIDVALSLLTGGGVTTDNVDDDNGTRITNTFPYIGAPNANPTGLNPAPPP